jgi:PAS domain S-box-containing protein
METVARASERQHAEEAVSIEQPLFKGILKIAEDAIISVGSNQRILLFNHGAEKVFGYAASEVIGEPLGLLMPQRFVEAHRTHVDEFAESPDVARPMGQRRAVFGRRKDGREFPAEASISKLDLGGELVFTVILRDITERKRAAEELEQMAQEIRCREAELRQLIDFVPQHIIVLGPDGHRLHANKVSLEYTGYTLEEFRATDYSRVVHPDDLDRIRSEAQRVARGIRFEMEGRLLGQDGQYRWFLLRYNPMRDADGRIVRWYVTGTDIDDRKQAEERVHRENIALRDEVDKTSMFEEIVGASPALEAVLSRLTKVAPTESTVLISGETGTGKELVARAIHKRSPRAAHAFVSVNCAGIPQSLIASELFGHEKGAFTGAVQRRLGRFELAEGGTLFLDEVGELPAETQIALLRVLQEREFERVGGNKAVRADVRLIAATNRDLQVAVDAGTFRSDLFYRLNVFPIEMPALRERKDDIPTLVEYFIARYAGRVGKKISGIDTKTLELLQSYAWPGNIRELQNVIERSVILCETKTFSIDENWLSSRSPRQPVSPALNNRLASNQAALIEAALAEAKGRVSGPAGAAARLGIPPSTLDSKIKAMKIDKQRFKHV